jgi:hypothetical protein
MDDAVRMAFGAEKKGYRSLSSRGVTSWKIKNSGIETAGC